MQLDDWLLPIEHAEPVHPTMSDELLTDRAKAALDHVTVLLKLAGLVTIAVALERHVGSLDAVALTFAFWAVLRVMGGRL